MNKAFENLWPAWLALTALCAGYALGSHNARTVDPYPVAELKAEKMVTAAEAHEAMRGVCVRHLNFTIRLLHRMTTDMGGATVNAWIEQVEREMGADSGWEVKENP